MVMPTRATSASLLKKFAGKQHFHCCATTDCRQIYGCSCSEPGLNGRCQTCRGTSRPIWESSRDPQPCCVDNTQQITTPEDLAKYRLAGPGPWFKCNTCARCHGRPATSTTLGVTP